jgi:hypothetical protein
LAEEWLFRGPAMRDVLEAREERLRAAVGRLTEAGLAEAGLAARLAAEHRVCVPALREEAACVVEHGEAVIETRDPVRLAGTQRGYRTVMAVPFEGDAALFRVQASPWAGATPRAEVRSEELRIVCESAEEDVAAIGQEYARRVAAIREQLARLRAAAAPFNQGLEALAERRVAARQREIEDPRALAELLGRGLREAWAAEPPKRAEARAESDREYEEALRAIRDMTRVMELDPGPFTELGEEDLRAHFLVHLNGRFGGRATGETYNFRGKTDILVRSGGRNVLVAECKFWSGESGFLTAVDQLLSYLSWRDTRAALLLFYRGANFSLVLERIASAMPGHAGFRRDLGKSDETTLRYVFGHPQDRAREVRLAVMAFDLPADARARNSAATELSREERMQALVEVLERRGPLGYEELARELGASEAYVMGMVNRTFKGSGLLLKRRRAGQVVVGLRERKG